MSMTDPLIGNKLGDYNIEGLLGTGGMARVYKGYDDNLARYAAIKVIEPQLIASAEEEEYRNRFLREARAIARLNHPRIVSVYQFNQVGNLYYIAMEYADGKNLREVLKEHIKAARIMPTADLMVVLRDIADALDYAHQQDIIHRDIKPSNIIINADGNAMLTDFGLALNATEGTIGDSFGSVHYIAPEQAVSSAQSVPQSDQYSLAIVAYELLTGRVPFDDASAMSIALKHISDPPPPPTELNPNIPAEVEQVLLKALDKEPHRRFETAREFVGAMELAFQMLDNADIEAPKTLTDVVEGQPATRLVAPTTGTPSSTSVPEASQPSLVTDVQPDARYNTGWMVAVIVIVVALLASGYLFSIGAFDRITDDELISTELALAESETRIAQFNISQTSAAFTQSVLDEQATSEAGTLQAIASAQEEQITSTESPTATATHTPAPTETPTPAIFIVDNEEDTRQVLLRYDGRTLLITNRDTEDVLDLGDLRFVLFEPNEDGDIERSTSLVLSSTGLDETSQNMLPERCLQILDNSIYDFLPADNPLADDVCNARPFWITTMNPFWISESSEAYFEVRLGPRDVIAICETRAPQTRLEVRCAFGFDILP